MKYSTFPAECNNSEKSWTFLKIPGELISVFFSLITVIFGVIFALSVQALQGTIPDFELNAFRMGGEYIMMSFHFLYRYSYFGTDCSTKLILVLVGKSMHLSNLQVLVRHVR